MHIVGKTEQLFIFLIHDRLLLSGLGGIETSVMGKNEKK